MNTIVAKIVWALIPLTACSSTPPSSGPVVPLPLHTSPDAAPATPGEPAISEVDARLLLNHLFRAEGLRIVNDVPLPGAVDIEVTLDGFDPERGIGYEYVAANEVGTDLSPEELVALAKLPDIFTASAMSAEQLREEAQAFLRDLAGAK